MNTVQNGFWSGVLATGPMTLAMFAWQRKLPVLERSPLPPATLTDQVTKSFRVNSLIPSNRRADLTMTSHFAFGITTGILYSFLSRRIKAPPVLKGSLFGLSVWAASYLGWIPAAGLRASAFKMPTRRNELMVAAHMVWGACLGFAENELARSGNQMLDGTRKALRAE